LNDHPVEIDAMTKWLVKHLGHDVPLHFACCHGQGSDRSGHVAATETLRRAQKIARSNGHSHVYLEDPDSTSDRDTGCDCCGRTLIVRQKGRLVRNDLVDLNACPSCGMRLQGRFFEPSWDPLKTGEPSRSKDRAGLSHGIRVKPAIGSAAF
jgi:pyruvate formate lyase activating enzyme